MLSNIPFCFATQIIFDENWIYPCTDLLCSARWSLSSALCLLLIAACWLMSSSYSLACASCTLSSRSWSLSMPSRPRHASSRCRCHDSTSVSRADTWPCSIAFWAVREAISQERAEFSTWPKKKKKAVWVRGERTVPSGTVEPLNANLLLGRLCVQRRVLLLEGGSVPLQRQHLVVERSVLVL